MRFEFSPFHVDGVEDPTEAATWGSLIIQVEDAGGAHVLTRVHDVRSSSMVDHVDGTVLPIAEWIASCWSHLVHGHRLPPSGTASRRESYRWRRCHDLRFVGEGTAVPKMRMWRSDRDTVRVVWQADSDSDTTYEPVRFLTSGTADLAREALQLELADFVDRVLRRCIERAPDHPRTLDLREAWRRATRHEHPEHRAARVAARLGDTWSWMDPHARRIVCQLAREETPEVEALEELVDIEQLEQLTWAGRHLHELLSQASSSSGPMARLRARLTAEPSGADWTRGWADARRVREVLGWSHDLPIDVDATDLPVQEASRDDLGGLLGFKDVVVGWTRGGAPRAVGPHASQSRFSRLRELWPALFDGPTDGPHAVALSKRLSGVTPVANAFAAELIAPVEAVREALGARREVDGDEVASLADELGAPWTCVKHQIENHRLAHLET